MSHAVHLLLTASKKYAVLGVLEGLGQVKSESVFSHAKETPLYYHPFEQAYTLLAVVPPAAPHSNVPLPAVAVQVTGQEKEHCAVVDYVQGTPALQATQPAPRLEVHSAQPSLHCTQNPVEFLQ